MELVLVALAVAEASSLGGCSRSGVLVVAVLRLSVASSEVGDIAAEGGDSDDIGGLPKGNALVFNFIPRLCDSDGFF